MKFYMFLVAGLCKEVISHISIFVGSSDALIRKEANNSETFNRGQQDMSPY